MQKLHAWIARLIIVSSAALSGCAHQITFEDAHYDIGVKKQNAAIVAVIDEHTLKNTVSIRAFMTGIGNSWDAQPGDMLKQVADIELPQMFERYEFRSSSPGRDPGGRRLILTLTIPGYAFDEFHATITVRAVATGAKDNVLLDKTYTAQGETEGAKMFWAGAFGMKSAVRQSSLDAYKKIFASLRADLSTALNPKPAS